MMMALAHSPAMTVGNDPEILPAVLDLTLDQVLLARMPLRAQREASFLDERAFDSGAQMEWLAWADFKRAAASAADASPAYILHVSHCGSTLLSRLVEAATGARSLREPLPLRTFAIEAVQSLDGGSFLTCRERAERLSLFEKAWCCGAGAVIKATSICNDIADDFDARAPVSFIYTRPEIHLASVLGRPRVAGDLRAYGQMRLRRWNARSGWPQRMCDLKPGELAALCWLTETTSILTAQRRIHMLDFDRFLADPADQLSRLCDRLDRPPAQEDVTRALAGPVMSQYSKNPARVFDASSRAQVLARAQSLAGDDIRDGMTWLNAAAKFWNVADLALRRFG